MSNEFELGIIGEVHPAVRERFDLRPQPLILFELQLTELLKVSSRSQRRFQPLPRFPAAIRDLALVVAADTSAGKVQDILTRHRLVDRVELFDIYTGEHIPPGSISLAFRVYFQSPERTLTAEEVNQALEGLLRTLEREVGASLRS
jgi:phenylalanyl-tRNA synthetase beta chain